MLIVQQDDGRFGKLWNHPVLVYNLIHCCKITMVEMLKWHTHVSTPAICQFTHELKKLYTYADLPTKGGIM